MARKKILVVDDDPAILNELTSALSAQGFDVMVAEDGGSAVSIIRGGNLDLVLLSIDLQPDVGHGGGVSWNGFLVMDWLRRIDKVRQTPVILTSDSDPDEYRDRAWSSGARGLFQKRKHNQALFATIHRILDTETCEVQSS